MESSVLMLLNKISFTPLNLGRKRAAPAAWPRTGRRASAHPISQKMYVPGFGEKSPEAKAAINIHDFFTYIAVRIVLAQLESYNTEAHQELMEFVDRTSLNDGDKFCADLMRESPRHKTLAMRILEVRSSYCKEDFEWDNMQRLAAQLVDESNKKLMREYLLETSDIEKGK
uniref:Chaperonin-like protein n=1 Tax=Kalanchoe fedtschenkoi TaxID=63787 RepID=A0A7N0UCU3_KALFE